MSPVDQSRGHVGRAATVALVGIVVLFAGLGLATFAMRNTKSGDVQLGDDTFKGGNTERLAKEIDRNGPILYADVSGRQARDMILQHLGDDPDEGWHAFLAAPVDRARDCTWDWQADRELFVAKCDPTLTAPADGAGLKQFEVTVEDGRIDVDLNAEERAAASTTAAG